ncbi:MAG: DUF839 domain-containing protein [Planctomycetota bacterium]|nr:DUF839 domain-containing protein [Planctomycetota bacterium]
MSKHTMRLAFIAGTVVPAAFACAQFTGSSTLQTPYVVPSASGVQTWSIASNGNGTGGLADETYAKIGGASGERYRLAGIPDGAGAYDNGDGTFTLLVNHEIGSTQGITRAHGTRGSFVSQWVVSKSAGFNVVGGKDLITNVANIAGGAAPFGRFCSADLPAESAFYNAATGLGTREKIFMNGEEVGSEGRAFGTVVSTGTAYYLPSLGKFSWENSIANPYAQDKTIVIGTDDSTPGQVYMYVGNKSNSANPIEAAGLNNGNLYGLRTSVGLETTANPGVGTASFANLTAFATGLGSTLDTESTNAGVTRYARPEDGAWNPARPGEFYWVNTGTADAPNRLYRLTLDDVNNPEAGGRVDMLLDGSEGTAAMDNMTLVVGRDGKTRLLIQEDPGSSSRLAKIWMYTVEDDSLLEVAAHDAKYFSAGGSNFLTTNEEASGIIPAWDILGDGWFLMDVQAHYGIGGELVEGGQLLAMYVPQSIPAPAGLSLLGLGGLVARRRRANAKA